MSTQAKKLLPLLAISLFSLGSCKSGNEQGTKKTRQQNVVKKIKHEDVIDAHSCNTSLGYIWSEAKDTCIRLWESGSELQAANRSEFVVYVVESEDKRKAEVFIPNEGSLILTGSGNGTYAGDSLSLSATGNKYLLKKNGTIVYQTGPAEPTVQEVKEVKRKGRRR